MLIPFLFSSALYFYFRFQILREIKIFPKKYQTFKFLFFGNLIDHILLETTLGLCYDIYDVMNKISFATDDSNIFERLDKFDPRAYQKSRNHLDGAVSGLSPYITHGLISTTTVSEYLCKKFNIERSHKFIQELTWREYFLHFLKRNPRALKNSIKPTIVKEHVYSRMMPSDVLEGTTGVPIIDYATRFLYEYGYLHNHARMWLASYIIHYRKISWQTGAEWMYGYLLDGDLASNHLSWQWVAGTLTGKPYLFNAENVAKYSSNLKCHGTQIDKTYSELGELAYGPKAINPEPLKRRDPALIPLLFNGITKVPLKKKPLIKKKIVVCHPWSLFKNEELYDAGLFLKEFHDEYQWCDKRWDFVVEKMQSLTKSILYISLDEFLEYTANVEVKMLPTLNPYYNQISKFNNFVAIKRPSLHKVPEKDFKSFSQFWKTVQSQKRQFL